VTDEERELLTNAARSLLLLQEQVSALEVALTELLRSHDPDVTLYRLKLWADVLKLKGQRLGYLDNVIARARRG
jgi:hypothetical protein